MDQPSIYWGRMCIMPAPTSCAGRVGVAAMHCWKNPPFCLSIYSSEECTECPPPQTKPSLGMGSSLSTLFSLTIIPGSLGCLCGCQVQTAGMLHLCKNSGLMGGTIYLYIFIYISKYHWEVYAINQ